MSEGLAGADARPVLSVRDLTVEFPGEREPLRAVDGLSFDVASGGALGAEKSSQPYAGGLVDGWDVPPLDALASARKPWTEEQLVSYLRTGIASEHSASAGPMLPVTHHLSRVPESDIRAIASYLMSLQPPVAARPAAQAERAPAPPDAFAPAATPSRIAALRPNVPSTAPAP